MPPGDYPPADHVHHVAMQAYTDAEAHGYAGKDMTMIPCGIVSERFATPKSRAELRREHGVPEDAFVILSVAAINRTQKRIDHLIDEVARLPGTSISCGWMQLRSRRPVAPRIRPRQLGARLRFTHVPSDRVGELYALADVMVLASINESFSLAVAEAMIAGTPSSRTTRRTFAGWSATNPCWSTCSNPARWRPRLAALREHARFPRRHCGQFCGRPVALRLAGRRAQYIDLYAKVTRLAQRDYRLARYSPLRPVPRILVGIPTLNRPDYVRQAVESVRSQTFEDWRIVLSDNASRPEAVAAVRAYVEGLRDPRISYWLQPKNIREYGNCEWLFRQCREDYFVILHDDDLLEPAHLATAIGCLDRHPELVSFCSNAKLIDPKGRSPPHERWTIGVRACATGTPKARCASSSHCCAAASFPSAAMSSAARRCTHRGSSTTTASGCGLSSSTCCFGLGERDGKTWFATEELVNYRFPRRPDAALPGHQRRSGGGGHGAACPGAPQLPGRGRAPAAPPGVDVLQLQARIAVRRNDLAACRRSLRPRSASTRGEPPLAAGGERIPAAAADARARAPHRLQAAARAVTVSADVSAEAPESPAGRVLVTGGAGFIGRHLCRALTQSGATVEVWTRTPPQPSTTTDAMPANVEVHAIDVRDRAAVMSALAARPPDRVFHLAGSGSWKVPQPISRHDRDACPCTLNVVAGVRADCRVVVVGSGEEYGRGPVPFRETQAADARTAYSISRLATTLACLALPSPPVCVARSRWSTVRSRQAPCSSRRCSRRAPRSGRSPCRAASRHAISCMSTTRCGR